MERLVAVTSSPRGPSASHHTRRGTRERPLGSTSRARKRVFRWATVAFVLFLGVPLASTIGDTQSAKAVDRPNVVLILADDQRWDQIARMPVLQSELLGKGTDFRNALVVNPLCCPSRATILTGQYSHTTKVWTNAGKYGGFLRFRDSSTVATWLHDAGYRTAFVGKYLNQYLDGSYIPPGWDVWNAFVHPPDYYDYTLTLNGSLQSFGSTDADYSTDVLAGKADAFIRSAPTSQPFFLLFGPYAPHLPAIPPTRYLNALSGVQVPHSPNWNEADVSDKPSWVRQLSATGTADAIYRKQLRMLLAVDDGIKKILGALQDTGRLANTLIIYMSDNGYSLRNHRWNGKDAPYEETIRVPMIIRFDPVTQGQSRSDEHLVLNLDIASTIADATGVSPVGAEGKSLLPLLTGTTTWRSQFLVEHVGGVIPTYCAVRTGNAKYVKYKTGEEELYDLVADPYELESKHADPAFADLRNQLHTSLVNLCSPPPPGLVP
jgi:N-acetylglucosamine-6-sulfatase